MTRRILLSLAVLLVLAAPLARADGPFRKMIHERMEKKQAGDVQTTTLAGLNVAYWLPANANDGPLPLVIFSHGLSGCKTQSKFLGEALAAHGYIMVAPDHKDASCGGGFHKSDQDFRDYASWNDQTYKDREADIKNLYAALKADKVWSAHIDWSRVALAGHSLGGYTSIGLAGGWPSWKMDGIKAVLALSPYVGPFIASGDLGHLSVPVMYQGGTRDMGITPSVKKKGGAYDLTSSPAIFVEFNKTGHLGWSDLQKSTHDDIVLYSLWFLDHTLNGSDAPLPKDSNVTDLRQK